MGKKKKQEKLKKQKEKQEKLKKPEKQEKLKKPEKPKKPEKLKKPEKAKKTEKPVKQEKPKKAETSVKQEKPKKTETPVKQEKNEKTGRKQNVNRSAGRIAAPGKTGRGRKKQTKTSSDDIRLAAERFRALGDENRLRILALLEERELCAGDLLKSLSIVQSTLSHHMKILVESGLVTCRKQGKWSYYSINADLREELDDVLGQWIQN